jgi:hypothetical protein
MRSGRSQAPEWFKKLPPLGHPQYTGVDYLPEIKADAVQYSDGDAA